MAGEDQNSGGVGVMDPPEQKTSGENSGDSAGSGGFLPIMIGVGRFAGGHGIFISAFSVNDKYRTVADRVIKAKAEDKIAITGEGLQNYTHAEIYMHGQTWPALNFASSLRKISFSIPNIDQSQKGGGQFRLRLLSSYQKGVNAQLTNIFSYKTAAQEEEEEKKEQQKKQKQQEAEGRTRAGAAKHLGPAALFMRSYEEVVKGLANQLAAARPSLKNKSTKQNLKNYLTSHPKLARNGKARQEITKAIESGNWDGLSQESVELLDDIVEEGVAKSLPGVNTEELKQSLNLLKRKLAEVKKLQKSRSEGAVKPALVPGRQPGEQDDLNDGDDSLLAEEERGVAEEEAFDPAQDEEIVAIARKNVAMVLRGLDEGAIEGKEEVKQEVLTALQTGNFSELSEEALGLLEADLSAFSIKDLPEDLAAEMTGSVQIMQKRLSMERAVRHNYKLAEFITNNIEELEAKEVGKEQQYEIFSALVGGGGKLNQQSAAALEGTIKQAVAEHDLVSFAASNPSTLNLNSIADGSVRAEVEAAIQAGTLANLSAEGKLQLALAVSASVKGGHAEGQGQAGGGASGPIQAVIETVLKTAGSPAGSAGHGVAAATGQATEGFKAGSEGGMPPGAGGEAKLGEKTEAELEARGQAGSSGLSETGGGKSDQSGQTEATAENQDLPEEHATVTGEMPASPAADDASGSAAEGAGASQVPGGVGAGAKKPQERTGEANIPADAKPPEEEPLPVGGKDKEAGENLGPSAPIQPPPGGVSDILKRLDQNKTELESKLKGRRATGAEPGPAAARSSNIPSKTKTDLGGEMGTGQSPRAGGELARQTDGGVGADKKDQVPAISDAGLPQNITGKDNKDIPPIERGPLPPTAPENAGQTAKTPEGAGIGADYDDSQDAKKPGQEPLKRDGIKVPAAAGETAKNKAIEALVKDVNRLMNAFLSKVAWAVWGSGVATFGLTILIGAIVGDFLALIKKTLIKRFFRIAQMTRVATGVRLNPEDVAKHIKFSVQVKAHIIAMNAVVLGLIAVCLLFVGGLLYIGCNTLPGYSATTNYKASILGVAGYSEVCESFMSIAGANPFTNLEGKVADPPASPAPSGTPASGSLAPRGPSN